MYAWDSLELQENLMKERDKTGRIVFQSKQVENLQSDTAYVAKIKVKSISRQLPIDMERFSS